MADQQGTISVGGTSGAGTQEGKISAPGSKRPSPVLHCRIACPCWPKTWGCGPRERHPQKSGVRHYRVVLCTSVVCMPCGVEETTSGGGRITSRNAAAAHEGRKHDGCRGHACHPLAAGLAWCGDLMMEGIPPLHSCADPATSRCRSREGAVTSSSRRSSTKAFSVFRNSVNGTWSGDLDRQPEAEV